jgi:Cytochrome c3
VRAGPWIILFVAGLLAAGVGLATPGPGPTPTAQKATIGCVECHLALDDATITPPAKAFGDDVHAHAGLTCADCHGGDPKADDQDVAHDPKKGFRGKPAPRDIPSLCGTCHADAAVMKRFNPSLRVDQLSEYRTSAHGKKLLQGDPTVATCASCHGAHGILPVKDSRSPVYPTHIAQTCNRCHGDAGLMAAHKLPADVYAKYAQSVHFEALMKKGDVSAPTCNTCHGNHGAAPPEVGSVANVCGTCHTIFAEQFKASPHAKAFTELGLPGCVTCHENHGIVHPSDAFLAEGDQSRCASCHEAGTAGAKAAAEMHSGLTRLQKETEAARAALRREAEAGMEVSRALFDLTRADEALTKARADVHLFQAAAVQQAVAGGLTVARKAREDGARLHREREFRRKGLFVSLGLILVAIVGLVLKIRDLGHRGAN